jgi:hypothetical protein
MKTLMNAVELKELNACVEGYETFKKAHGDKTVTLTEAFNSNGWSNVWWYLSNIYNLFSDEQIKDLRLLAADYAERSLPLFEQKCPENNGPRKAIQAARDYANGLICASEMVTASVDAEEAHGEAWQTWETRDSARYAIAALFAASDDITVVKCAWGAADYACVLSESDSRKWQEEKLLELFAKWEK